MIPFDIETNALTDWNNQSDLKTLHCIGLELKNGTRKVARSSHPSELDSAIKVLNNADAICGHNIISFDVPALRKLRPDFNPKGQIVDTKVMSRCIFPDLLPLDYQTFVRKGLPPKLAGSHSLKAWGIRIGVLKDGHGDTEDWSKLTPEMVKYCEQDVHVTSRLFLYLMRFNPSAKMLRLEHAFATEMRRQEANGFPFDVRKAEKLCAILMSERQVLKAKMQKEFKPVVIKMKSRVWVAPDGTTANTKKELVELGHKAKDIEKGDHRTKTIPFNPSSRDQIAERLMEEGWKPTAYDGKRPAINDVVLKKIGTPQALALCEYLMVSKRMGQLAEGKNAWLKLETNGRIHGQVETNGAVTGRCTHNRPNMAQVPAVRAKYGTECRGLFSAPKGKVLVGVDASGLELRCLAHYLGMWDGGAYGKTILEGDIHTVNQKAAGLDTRDQAKTFIYAFLYGAGDAKIGEIVGGSRAEGKRLKASFKKKLPAIAKLIRAVTDAVTLRKELRGLDGRKLPCRSEHSALNMLLQSAGAVIMKQSLVTFAKKQDPSLYEMHANVHDEVQFSCNKEHADMLGQAFVDAIRETTITLNLRCPLDGEYKIGKTWADTH